MYVLRQPGYQRSQRYQPYNPPQHNQHRPPPEQHQHPPPPPQYQHPPPPPQYYHPPPPPQYQHPPPPPQYQHPHPQYYQRQAVLSPKDNNYSFDNFPYYLNPVTREILRRLAFVHLKCNYKVAKFSLSLSSLSPRILLSGPAGSEIYQETLVKALAKEMGAGLLIVGALQHQKRASISEDEVFMVASNESKRRPLIVFIKDIEKLMVSQELKRKLENLPDRVVVICSQTQLDSHKEKDNFIKHVEEMKIKELSRLFPNDVTIQPPEDGGKLLLWKHQLERDIESLKVQANILGIRSVLDRVGLNCHDPLSLCTDQALTPESIEKVIGWALGYQLNCCSEASAKDAKTISNKSMEQGFCVLKSLQGGRNSLTFKEFVTENEFEKQLLVDVIRPTDIGVTFTDIGGLEILKDNLKLLVIFPFRRPEMLQKGQLAKHCKGILLFGPPGTGKTMLAKAVANEASANLMNISLSSITPKGNSDVDKYIKAVFSLAGKIAPTVILFDELDSMLGINGAMRHMRNEFMVNWDVLSTKDRVVVLGASNRPFELDDAIVRRLPRRFYVSMPDAPEREKILKAILVSEALDPVLDLNEIAVMTDGYSGSDLKNLCETAALCPISEILKQEKERETATAENNFLPPLSTTSDIRPLCRSDFTYARQQVCGSSSSKQSLTEELLQWNDEYGEAGSRKPWLPSYYT